MLTTRRKPVKIQESLSHHMLTAASYNRLGAKILVNGNNCMLFSGIVLVQWPIYVSWVALIAKAWKLRRKPHWGLIKPKRNLTFQIMPQSPADLQKKKRKLHYVLLSVQHAQKGEGADNWCCESFFSSHISSVQFSFSCLLRKPHLTIDSSILAHSKQCCLFSVLLPWFPLCLLPELIWRTKRWWWVVYKERGKDND